MKVDELKNWLADFGEKNKQHYHCVNHHDHMGQGGNDCLAIQSKPSTAETSPSSSRDSNSPRADDNLHPSIFISDASGLNFDMNHDGSGLSPVSSSCSSDGMIKSASDAFRTSSTNSNSSVLEPSKTAASREDLKGQTDKAPSEDKPPAIEANSSVRSNGSKVSPVDQLNDQFGTITLSSSCDESHEGPIKMIPSADPTMTTQDESQAADSMSGAATESWDSWNEEEFPEPEFTHCESYDEFDSSSLDSGRRSAPRVKGGRSEDYRRKTFVGIQGLDDNMGHEHLTLLRKQHPILTPTLNEANNENPDSLPTEEPKMHNANLLINRTLTSSTLDFICNDGQMNKPKMSSDNTIESSSDDGATSSWSNDSSKPSIAPGALDSKMARIFWGEIIDDSAGQTRWPSKKESDDKTEGPSQPVTRKLLRKKLDPKDLPFLQSQPKPEKKIESTQRKARSSVHAGIGRFGGPKKRIVESRTEQLQKLWAENKAATHVKKIKWGVCQKTGVYKKKVVVDVQYK
jgi:hypothetical protein